MPVEFSKAEIIRKNDLAIAAIDAAIERLEGMVGLPSSREVVRVAQLSRARNERTQLKSVTAHYRASGTVVKPLADNVAAELNELGNKLDDQIARDLIINASLDFITSVLSDAAQLRQITEAHKG